MKKLNVENPSGAPFYARSSKRRFRGRHLLIILLMAGAGLGIYREVRQTKSNPPERRAVAKAAVPRPIRTQPKAAATAPGTSDPFEIRHLTLHGGDTLERIVKESAIPGAYADYWRKACKSAPFDRIGNDDELIFVLSRANGLPVKAVYLRSGGGSYTLRKTSSGWKCGSSESAAGVPGKTARGIWSKSFHHSCIAAGLPAPLISAVADIFSYDIDFSSDLKNGDSFSVFFQQYPIESSHEKRFLILGAEMNVSGKVYQAFGFQLPDGSWDYFDAKGASLKREFSRSPVNYRPLPSAGAYGNIRPVLKVFRPHFGIMYIVPKGTGVCAVGDGVVRAIHRHARRDLSIEIRHRGGYTSLYGNLSSCRRGLRRGSPVSRTEEIGSAGSYGSGKAYFYFHFYKNGKPVNFESGEFARSKSVPAATLAEFEKSRDFCTAALHRGTPDGQKHEMLSGKD